MDKLVKQGNRFMVKDAIKRSRQVSFLQALAVCGVISKACEAIGINMTTERSWRNSVDPWYADQFKQALQKYRESIEAEIHDRAINGVSVPIVGKRQTDKGPEDVIIGHKTVKSDLLLMFHAKRHIAEYRDKYEQKSEDDKPVETVSPLTRITMQIDIMAQRREGAETDTPSGHIKAEVVDTETIDAEIVPPAEAEQPRLTEGTPEGT